MSRNSTLLSVPSHLPRRPIRAVPLGGTNGADAGHPQLGARPRPRTSSRHSHGRKLKFARESSFSRQKGHGFAASSRRRRAPCDGRTRGVAVGNPTRPILLAIPHPPAAPRSRSAASAALQYFLALLEVRRGRSTCSSPISEPLSLPSRAPQPANRLPMLMLYIYPALAQERAPERRRPSRSGWLPRALSNSAPEQHLQWGRCSKCRGVVFSLAEVSSGWI